MSELLLLLIVVAMLSVPVVAVVYFERTRWVRRGGGAEDQDARILDSLDQVHLRLDALGERLAGLEEAERIRGRVSPGVGDPTGAEDPTVEDQVE